MGGIVRTIGQIGAFAIGTAIGGTFGGAVGNTLFNMLFPTAKPTTPSTRLTDLMREGAEIGTPVKSVYGIMQIKGDFIDCGVDKKGVPAGIQEVVKKKKAKGATGGGKSETTKEYSYYLTAAVLLGEGLLYVDQIKYDDSNGTERVLYDRWKAGQPDPKSNEWRALWNSIAKQETAYVTGTGKGGVKLTPQYSGGELVAELSQNLRLYPGTERQMPDTALQVIHGAATCPYRGRAYVMFNHLPINGSMSFTFVVRSPITGRTQIIKKRLMDAGVKVERIALNSISGDIHGAAVAQLEPARELGEKIAAAQYHDLLFINGGFRDASRLNPATWQIGAGKLGAHVVSGGKSEPPSKVKITLPPVSDRASSVTISFIDPNDNYQQSQVVAQRNSAEHENPVTIELPFAANPSEMLPLADIMLDEMWASDGTEEIATLPEMIQVAPGNVLIYPDETGLRRIRITKQGLGVRGPLVHTGAPYDSGVYGIHRIISDGSSTRPTVPQASEPIVFVGDLPGFSDERRSAPSLVFAATTTDADGYDGVTFQSDNFFGTTEAELQATIGELLTPFAYTDADLDRINYGGSGQNEVQRLQTNGDYAGGAIEIVGSSSTQSVTPGDSLEIIATKWAAAFGLDVGELTVNGSSSASDSTPALEVSGAPNANFNGAYQPSGFVNGATLYKLSDTAYLSRAYYRNRWEFHNDNRFNSNDSVVYSRVTTSTTVPTSGYLRNNSSATAVPIVVSPSGTSVGSMDVTIEYSGETVANTARDLPSTPTNGVTISHSVIGGGSGSGGSIRVQLFGFGNLASCAESDLANRANVLALGDMLLSYVQATPVDGLPDAYDLTGLMPGRFGTDWISSVAAVTRVLKVTDESGALDGAIEFIPVPLSKLGLDGTYEAVASDDDSFTTGVEHYTLRGNNLKPPRILEISKGDDGSGVITLSFFPRTRDWDSADGGGAIVRETDPRRVTVQLRNGTEIVDTRTVDSLTLPIVVDYSAAELTAWFGAVPPSIIGSVWHEGTFLRGHERVFTI